MRENKGTLKTNQNHFKLTINAASRVLTSHVFQATRTFFKLLQAFIGTNLLTKFHNDQTINVATRVLTRKIAPPTWQPYFIGTNLLTKFHHDQTINVATRVKIAPPTWQPSFIGTNLLTKFHHDQTINVAARVLTRKNAPAPGIIIYRGTYWTKNVTSTVLTRNVLTKFHEDWIKIILLKKTAPSPGGHTFSIDGNHFRMRPVHIMNTALHTLRVLTRFYYGHIWKTAPPPGGHSQYHLDKFLYRFHEDTTIHVNVDIA
ncbi:hypothetical protein DPMN_181889 [Dreissena polymorpha]|uniref:Uncharacterized protein n=1 Tax=Dreissena polymorpha TaxID=45954 RepID=A0A9D4I5P7_DREPO|nr:hypothetical protein DPMN_181889 [Dreissena polymorpha]